MSTMDHIFNEDRASAMASFTQISTIQSNGVSIVMAQCNNCGMVKANVEQDMWKHWKYTCTRKLFFKYCYPTASNAKKGITITCLICGNNFKERSIRFMISHRSNCTKEKPAETIIDHENDDVSTVAIDSDDSQDSENSEHSIEESAADDDLAAFGPVGEVLVSVQTKPLNTESLEVDNYECANQELEIQGTENHTTENHTTVSQVTENHIAEHHTTESHAIGNQENSNTTSGTGPTESRHPVHQTVDSSKSTNPTDDLSSDENQFRDCFICNSPHSAPFTHLYEPISSDSNKLIVNFLWKILDSNKPSTRMCTIDANYLDEGVVCGKCLKSIRKHDQAQKIAKHVKKKLTKRLAETEAKFSCKNEKVEDGMVPVLHSDAGDGFRQEKIHRITADDNTPIDLSSDD